MNSFQDSSLVLESCHSTWYFDLERLRFRRELKGPGAGAATPWQPFSRLELDDDEEHFVIWLNEAGTRRLRSWRHGEDCSACSHEATVELDLESIAAADD